MSTVATSSSDGSHHLQQSCERLRARLRTKWLALAPTGLVLLGTGVSLVGEALRLKIAQADFWEWFIWGTLALIVFNAGIVVFGEAVKCRVLYELADRKDMQ